MNTRAIHEMSIHGYHTGYGPGRRKLTGLSNIVYADRLEID